ncbi:hypothetical protein B0H63DRAFT_439963 [Podospora didyma]|uniref:Uncharacterized protein n=1 Tax=Podospora didyma TaxID=330526 RepID=A0AAE0K9L1_9PEZI|nr:hypothetical protein B0H63DRAFT_439963 [Podospora didyma]
MAPVAIERSIIQLQDLHISVSDTAPRRSLSRGSSQFSNYISESNGPRYDLSEPDLRHSRLVQVCLGPAVDSNNDRPVSPESLDTTNSQPQTASEFDIELGCLIPPATGTYSTEELITSPTVAQPRWDAFGTRARSTTRPTPRKALDGDRLNFKPIPLLWPFQAVMLLLIAGFFVFLEYEVHILPHPNFEPLEVSAPGPLSMAEIRYLNETTATKTIVQARGQNMSPDPDPRQSQSAYPTPGIEYITTYCGWGAPQWLASIPGYMENWKGQSAMYLSWDDNSFGFSVVESIRTFTTSNPSWCPCGLRKVSQQSGEAWDLPETQWQTTEKACESVMNLVMSLNNLARSGKRTLSVSYKPFYWPVEKTMARKGGPYADWYSSISAHGFSTWPAENIWTAPPPFSPTWVFPTSDTKGNVLIPLEARTSVSGRDVFGNTLGAAPFTGLFPVTGLPNPKSTPTPSIFWWTLPLGRGISPSPVPTGRVTWDPFAMLSTITTLLMDPGTLTRATASTAPGKAATAQPHSTIQTTSSSTTSTIPNPLSSKLSSATSATLSSTEYAPASTMSSTHTVSISLSFASSSPSTEPGQQRTSVSSSTSIYIPVPVALGSPSISYVTVTRSWSITAPTNPTTSLLPTSKYETLDVSNSNGVSSKSIELHKTSASAQTSDLTQNEQLQSTLSSIRKPSGVTLEPVDGVVVAVESTLSKSGPTATRGMKPQISPARTQLALASTVNLTDGETTDVNPTPTNILPPSGINSTMTKGLTKGSVLTTVVTDDGTTLTVTASIDQISNANISLTMAPITSSKPAPSQTLITNDGITTAATTEPSPTTTTDSLSLPSIAAEPTQGPISPEAQGKYFNLRTEGDYLMISLLPVLLATIVGIPIQVFSGSLDSMRPFRALTSQGKGALAEDSLCLPRSSLLAPVIGMRFLHRYSDPLPLLNVLLGMASTALIPLASETVRLEFLPFKCDSGVICPIGLRKSELPIRTAEALLAAMAALVLSMGFLLARWKTGVATEPWSVAAMAALLASSSITTTTRSQDEHSLKDAMLRIPPHADGETRLGNDDLSTALERGDDGTRFRLGHWPTDNEQTASGYGIGILPARNADDRKPIPKPTTRNPPTRTPSTTRKKHRTCGWAAAARADSQETWLRSVFLILIIGLLVLILYYENTILDTPFEAFMDSQTFGVRVLFTSLGTIVTLFWDYYFSRVSEYNLYQSLSTHPPKLAHESVLLSPPSSLFAGIWRALRTRDGMLGNVALCALLAKFAPILFSAIPFRNTVTWKMHESCTWMAVALLAYMVVVLVLAAALPYINLIMRKKQGQMMPDMPVEPNSIAGCMYYVCDSGMLKDFEGLATIRAKERDRLVGIMGKRYVFGAVVGISGGRRIAVDYAT